MKYDYFYIVVDIIIGSSKLMEIVIDKEHNELDIS